MGRASVSLRNFRHRFHKEKALARAHDLPIMVGVVDEEEKIRAYLPLLDEMVQEGLVVLSDVDVIRYRHRTDPEAGGEGLR